MVGSTSKIFVRKSKLAVILENSVSKNDLLKSNLKIMCPELVFLIETKKSKRFWWFLTWKIYLESHILTNCHSLYSQNMIVSIEYVDFWSKIMLFRIHHCKNSATKLMPLQRLAAAKLRSSFKTRKLRTLEHKVGPNDWIYIYIVFALLATVWYQK